MHLRDATAEDVDLLTGLLVDSVNWTGETRVTASDITGDAHLARYLVDWPRPTDVGTVAVGDAGAPLGAAWARLFTPDAPGYGFVAPDVPELGMAVLAGARGRGVGHALLDACVGQVRDRGWRAVSLSVEDGNDVARNLYERAGFEVVGREGGSDTMLLSLR